MSIADELARREAERLPEWIRRLDTRERCILMNAFNGDKRSHSAVDQPYGGRTDFHWVTPEIVRSLGRAWFAELPNCGTKSLGTIGAAIGGWTSDASDEAVRAIQALFGNSATQRKAFARALRALAEALEAKID